MNTLRSFLEDLEKNQELKTIDEEVDELKASAILAMSQKVGGPALRFTNIKGYPGPPW